MMPERAPAAQRHFLPFVTPLAPNVTPRVASGRSGSIEAGIVGNGSISVRHLLAIVEAHEAFMSSGPPEWTPAERCAFVRAELCELCKLLPIALSAVDGA